MCKWTHKSMDLRNWLPWALPWGPFNIPQGNWLSLNLKITFLVTFFIREVEEKFIRAKIICYLSAERKLIMQIIISSQSFWMNLSTLLQHFAHRAGGSRHLFVATCDTDLLWRCREETGVWAAQVSRTCADRRHCGCSANSGNEGVLKEFSSADLQFLQK